MSKQDADAALFDGERKRLLALAYRLLGSVSDAEDAVQDAWLRWQGAQPAPRSPAAWLTTTVARLALDRLRRRRGEPYTGPWLPEPLATDDPDLVEQLQDLTQGLLWMLERLTPRERTALVLREALGDDFRSIGAVLGAREETCRQYYHRARRRLQGEPRFDTPDRAAQRRVLERMLAAIEARDRDALHAALHGDAVAIHDGGGVVPAAIRPIEGAPRIVQVYMHLHAAQRALQPASTFRLIELPAEPALAVFSDGRLDSISTLSLRDGRAARLLAVRQPIKLAGLARSLGCALAHGDGAAAAAGRELDG